MRIFVPELEILLKDVKCGFIKCDGESVPCLIINFVFCKNSPTPFVIRQARGFLKREGEVFPLKERFATLPLKDIQLEKEKSNFYTVLIRMSDLPFPGVQFDDKLVFSVDYSKGEKQCKKTIAFIMKDSGWELYGNACDMIQNSHFRKCNLTVFDWRDYAVSLTGAAYDFEKTYFYFAISNYLNQPIELYAPMACISTLCKGETNFYDDSDISSIATVAPMTTSVGVMEIGNRSFNDIDFDLMTELAENHEDFKATVSMYLVIKADDENFDIGDWIVCELGMTPSEPRIAENYFEYEEPRFLEPANTPSSVLTYQDFIVYAHALMCLNNHKTETVNAVIQIATPNGNIVEKAVPAAYCATCDRYIILDRDYLALKQYGVLMCKQQSYDVFVKNSSGSMSYRNWNEESQLRQLGYNVNAKEDLSASQRQAILRGAVDSGLMTTEAIRSFLQLQIDTRVNNPIFDEAIEKWSEDIEYISQYQADQNRNVGIKSISKTNYHKKP